MNVKRFDSEDREITDKKPFIEASYERRGNSSEWPLALMLITAILSVVAVCAITAWWTK